MVFAELRYAPWSTSSLRFALVGQLSRLDMQIQSLRDVTMKYQCTYAI